MKHKSSFFDIATMMIAIGASFLLAFIIILFVSDQPGVVMSSLLFGPFSSLRNFGNIIELMTTFIFTGLAISVMFQAGQFNVGAEGSFFIGALAATSVATSLSSGFTPVLAIMAGAGAGAVITFIPGILKAKLGANELVSSLMINYASLYLGLYILNYYMRDATFGMLASDKIAEASKLANLIPGTRVNMGLVIAVALLIIIYLFLYRSHSGYDIRLVGQNSRFAHYTGVNIANTVILSQILGGVIAGAGGASELLGMYNRFQWTSLPGYGWDGVVVAILAYNKPQYIPLAAFFLAYLRIGSDIMARATDVPRELIIVIQAVIILLITSKAMLGNLKHKSVVKEAVSRGNNI